MPFTFERTTAQPGQPVTAQGWNNLVNAIGAIIDFIDASANASVKVQVGGVDDDDLSSIRVTATANGMTYEAVRPFDTIKYHLFHGLPAGTYSIRAEGAGYNPATTTFAVTATAQQQTNLTMTKVPSVTMPLVFGLKLGDALPQLKALGISVDDVRDVTGVAVSSAEPPTRYTQEIVLVQYPLAGLDIAPTAKAKLVISATRAVDTVMMPSLIGKTQSEAAAMLEAMGLHVGTATTKTPSAPAGGTSSPASTTNNPISNA